MPTLNADLPQAWKGILDIHCQDRGFTEAFVMKDTMLSGCRLALKHLAFWRAATLGVDAKVQYAVLSTFGPQPTSDVVIERPINGGVGVKFPDGTETANPPEYTSDAARAVNNVDSGIRMRFQTAALKKSVRLFRCVPDAWMSRNKFWTRNEADLYPDFTGFDTPYTLDDAELPVNAYWPKFGVAAPVNASSFVHWDAAFVKLLQVVFNHTCYGKLVEAARPEGGDVQKENWDRIVYRGVGSRRAGRPSLR